MTDVHAVTLEAGGRAGPLEPSFAAVAEELLDDVYGYLLYLTKNWALAEDLTSETFERALKRWKRFDARRGTPRAWLLAIARSTALDSFRADARRRRREAHAGLDAGGAPADHGFAEGLSAELENGLRALSVGEREVVALRVVLELGGDETARLLGISPTAVSTRLQRALAKLEERMQQDERVA